MEYNTQREKIAFNDYGRTVHKLIEYAISQEDREERNKLAEMIVGVMSQVNPKVRDCADYKRKLWDHLLILSDWRLDVDVPYDVEGVVADRPVPQRVGMHDRKAQYKHYGKVMEEMVRSVGNMEDGDEKDDMTKRLAADMKMLYRRWNNDDVEDAVIKEQIGRISGGSLVIDDDYRIEAESEASLKVEGERKQKKKHSKKK